MHAILMCLVIFMALPSWAGAVRVLVDPGHGGQDHGARRGDLREADIALKISQNLADLLQKDPRFQVALTRVSDEAMTLTERAERIEKLKGDLLISVHANSSTDPRAAGLELYIQNQLPADEESMFLASRENAAGEDENAIAVKAKINESLSVQSDLKSILEDLRRNHRIRVSRDLSSALLERWPKETRRSSRTIRQAPFVLVSQVSMPSVLVEVGYLTHATEGPRLATHSYQKQVAQNLYLGLVKFLEVMEKDQNKRSNYAL